MAAAAPAHASLRVVLFGRPGAGKSTLLTALGVPATALPPGEVVAYPVVFAPPAGADADGGRTAVVYDCDGRAAEELLRRPEALGGHGLAGELLRADAVVLAIDASTPAARLDADFADFDRFLRRMEHGRGRRTEVADLPVYLVLTKCDLLARPGEGVADWIERVEERKREVGARFHDFVSRRDAAGQPPPFGRVRLHLWATAAGRPALAGAAPHGPYGVAELFRQCLDQAEVYRGRRRRANRRLAWMTTAAGGGALVLLAATGLLLTARLLNPPPSELQIRLESLRLAEGPPEQRLRGPMERLNLRVGEFEALRADPAFRTLPQDLRDWAADRLRETKAYAAWLNELEQLPRPREELTEQAVRDLSVRLDGPLSPPDPDWDRTEAAELWRGLRDESDALVRALATARDWYLRGEREAEDLWAFSGQGEVVNWKSWERQAEDALAPDWIGPYTEGRPIVGGDDPLPFAAVYEFGTVAEARGRWEAARGRLRRLREVSGALGLIKGVKDLPPVLAIPDEGFTLEDAAARAKQLHDAYADADEAFTGRDLPAAVAADLRARAAESYRLLLKPARALVLRWLREAEAGGAAGAEAWPKVRGRLDKPAELAGWRDLARALARLSGAGEEDPVAALAAFLDQKSFPLQIHRITIDVPDEAGVEPAPDAALTVHYAAAAAPGAEAAAALTLEAAGATRVGARPVKTYAFRAAGGRTLDYAPGGRLYAELPLTGGRRLLWDRHRSDAFQFEALAREPVLLERGQPPAAGAPQGRVRLQVEPAGGVPRVPDLLPDVNGEGG
jgi:hypothetical protein